MHLRRLSTHRLLAALTVLGVAALVLTLVFAAGGTAQAAPQAQPQKIAPNSICIEGNVYADEGVNGLLPLADWTVTISKGATTLTQKTDANGHFRFDLLATGVWKVTVEPIPAGWAGYPGVPTSVNVTVPGNGGCATAWFKMIQVPTPTPTPGPDATRIRGNVYELKCDGIYPLNNVELELSKSATSDFLGTLVQTRFTDPGGFFNFYVQAAPPPYYHLVVKPPAGLVPDSASSLEGLVVDATHILFAAPKVETYEGNKFVLKDPNLKCGTDTPTPTPTLTPTATPTPQTTGCIDGYVVDDLHVGLPGWEVHATPKGAVDPNFMDITDGEGYYRFDDLALGVWVLYTVPKVGWAPVTDEMFEVTVKPGDECQHTRFKYRQQTPTPTPTLTPTATLTPTEPPPPPENPLYFPLILRAGDVCEVGTVQVEVWGVQYSFPLGYDGLVKFVQPLPWQTPTVFKLWNYEGSVIWTQYLPFYHKQIDGMEFTYPGGYSGEDFKLFIRTECGLLLIETSVDDPTPTPSSQNSNLPTPVPSATPPMR